MGQFAVGQVVSSIFPYSDLTSKKVRPALIVAIGEFGDVILCQITSRAYSSERAIMLNADDFIEVGLPVRSHARPDKLFTADTSMISRVYGQLKPAKLTELLVSIQELCKV